MEVEVLIVYDQIITQKYIAKILSKKSCKINFAEDGSEALQKYLSKKYDLIFIDNQMPNMSGVETIKKIRLIGYNQDTCVIFVTADVFSKETVEDLGFSDYIKKLFEPKDISIAYDRLVAKSHLNIKSDSSDENKKM